MFLLTFRRCQVSITWPTTAVQPSYCSAWTLATPTGESAGHHASMIECRPGPSYWHYTGRVPCLSCGFLSVFTASLRAEPGDSGAAWLGSIPRWAGCRAHLLRKVQKVTGHSGPVPQRQNSGGLGLNFSAEIQNPD